MNSPAATPQAVYNMPPGPNDINLVAEVRQILVENGLGVNLTSAYDHHPQILAAVGLNENVQRDWMNRYWNVQLMSVSASSVNQRYCLTPNGSVAEWLRLFRDSIVPFCVEHNLPRVLTRG